LASAAELRDPYTAGHQRRVAELAGAISQQLGLDANEQEGIITAATIHDIGKLSLPAEILSKPGQLSAQEMALVKNHARGGYEIVCGIDFPWPVADMILQHHERLDGSGYPNGLTRKDILLGAQIIAVADTVEAMSSHRPYRPALGLDAALNEIETGRGVAYNSAVVDACLIVCRQPNLGFDPRGSEPFGTFA
jgi:putative nucleotidyltransferase with HDIG domain